MIGLDTNVLLRAFVLDDGEQTERARRLIARCTADHPVYISAIALAEAIWVLEARYGYGRNAIAAIVEQLLMAADVVLEHEESVRSVARTFLRHNVDFADVLMAHIGAAAGCKATATFDKRAAKLDGFMAMP